MSLVLTQLKNRRNSLIFHAANLALRTARPQRICPNCDTLQRRRVTQFYAVQSNRNRGPMSIMATVPNLPKPSAPSASSDTVVDLCSTCFVCNQGIREATTEEDGEQALWCESLHKQWAHARCVNVSEELYQALQESLMPWTCASCMQEALRAYHCLPGLHKP